jgi:hypothetical protein
LNDNWYFPDFEHLGDENDPDMSYYDDDDGHLRPIQHWCFVAEITQVVVFIRPQLFLKDKKGKEMQAYFYLDDKCMCLNHESHQELTFH